MRAQAMPQLLETRAWRCPFRGPKNARAVHGIKGIGAIAEFTTDLDAATLDEDALNLGFAQRAQDSSHAITRAAALKEHRRGLKQAHVILGKQAVQKFAFG